jgi:hypothetical protein
MMPLPMPALMATAMLSISTASACGEETPMRTSIQEVKQKHATRLMGVHGVVSVGIGRNEDGQDVIVVGLDRERATARAQLPECLEGYEVRAEVVGKVKAR